MSGDGPDTTPPVALPTRWGTFQVVAFRFPDGAEHVAILKGDPQGEALLTRVHSSCVTGDILGSHRCDCGPQLRKALQAIETEGRGVVLYLQQEGRGIGLFNKMLAYHEQDKGADTVEANVRLGFEPDARRYDHAVAMLSHLGATSVRLMTNNPRKVTALEAAGVRVAERVPHEIESGEFNRIYLAAKRDLLGHFLQA